MPPDDSRTGTTLHVLLRDVRDPHAWAAFVTRYAPRVHRWCRQWGLQPADADDVTQDVLLRLARKLGDFRYDRGKGTFRGWLKTLAHHAWRDSVGGRKDAVAPPDRLATAEARDDLARELDSAFDLELAEAAQARVRLLVKPHTWQAFRLLAVDGLSGAEAAARLGVSVAAAFMARSRVQRLLREELARLEDG